MSRYTISPEASHDIDEISDYFANRNIEAGERDLPMLFSDDQE